jgi:aspartyl-tRNA(Asn)/glutamyl-tRNA(Gln) amidotransferase subunit B
MSTETKNALARYPEYEATIGIEVHIQLKTESKIFCSCPRSFGQEPNSNVCPVCLGHPGVLPVLNKKVVDFAIMVGLATNCSITRSTDFARKHYMYPDLPKNYQITQSDKPICQEGFITIQGADGAEKKVRLLRIHMEEDAGKNLHSNKGYSLVDLNRAGTPLLEVVTHPDISTAQEADAYLKQLHAIVQYLGVSDANMDEGSFRADINISVKKKTAAEFGVKVELKNINSFRFIAHAIEYELERQLELVTSNQRIYQETRLWDSKQQKSIFMRSKEEAQDYRYFNEPDLPVIEIDDSWIERIRKNIPELPREKFLRLQKEYALSSYEAEIMIEDKSIADFFEATVAVCNNPKLTSNWILRDVLGYLKEHKIGLHESKITANGLGEMIIALEQGVINSSAAQEVFLEMAQTGKSPHIIIDEKDLKQIGSSEELEAVVKQVIEQNADSVKKYQEGNARLFMFFVGQTMKATKGKGNPVMINDLLKKYLG